MAKEDDDTFVIVSLEDAILAPCVEIRRAVVDELHRLAKNCQPFWDSETHKKLELNRADVLSEDINRFADAAIAIADNLSNDFFFQNKSLEQGIELSNEKTTESGLRFLLSPRLRTFVFLDDIPFRRPSFRSGDFLRFIESLASTSVSIEDLCDKFFRYCGYLPLSREFGLAAAVTKYIESNHADDLWSKLDQWVTVHGSWKRQKPRLNGRLKNANVILDGRKW